MKNSYSVMRPYIIIWMVIITSMTNVCVSQVITSPPLETLRKLCPGDVVNITCVTRGSSVIAWSSDEYIEEGGTQLAFATFNHVGDTQRSPITDSTLATLTSKVYEGTVPVLESRLHIIVSSTRSVSTVTCIHVSGGTSTAISIQTLAPSNQPAEVVSTQTLGAAGSCSVHLSWSLPNNTNILDVTHFAVSINGTNIANETNTFNQTLSAAAYTLCSCAHHNISISAVNRCGSEGQSSPNITVNLPPSSPVLDIECLGNPTTDSETVNTGGSNEIDGTNLTVITVTVVIVALMILLIITIGTTLIFIFCLRVRHMKRPNVYNN